MSRHILKYEYDNGVKLELPIYWCSQLASKSDWAFIDIDHAALSVGGSVAPCKNCIKAVIKELQKEL